MTCFLRLWKENEAANTQTRHILETAVTTYSVKSPSLLPGAYAFHRLCRSLVVMMYPTSYRNGNHLVWLVRERSRMHRRLRDPLPKPLMGSGLIEIDNILVEKPGELLLMEDQEMIQAFSPHA